MAEQREDINEQELVDAYDPTTAHLYASVPTGEGEERKLVRFPGSIFGGVGGVTLNANTTNVTVRGEVATLTTTEVTY